MQLEFFEGSKPKIPPPAISLDRVFARIDAQVGRIGAELAKDGLPSTLPTPYIEDTSQGSREDGLRHGDGQRDVSAQGGGRTHGLSWTSIPGIEVVFVVSLAHFRTNFEDESTCHSAAQRKNAI
jgi:hypothetical protein